MGQLVKKLCLISGGRWAPKVRPMVQATGYSIRNISTETKEKQWLMVGADYHPRQSRWFLDVCPKAPSGGVETGRQTDFPGLRFESRDLSAVDLKSVHV